MHNYSDLDSFDHYPLIGKISPAACLGRRTLRPYCPCCGGSVGVRAARFRLHKHQNKGSVYTSWNTMRKFGKRKGFKPRLDKHNRSSIRYME